MAYDEKLAQRVRQALSGQDGIVEKKMFGGLAFMLHGNMSVGVEKDRLMVRVGPDRYDEALARPHARPMDFTGRPMKGFCVRAPGGPPHRRRSARMGAHGRGVCADVAGEVRGVTNPQVKVLSITHYT
jgi:hypothetical protein